MDKTNIPIRATPLSIMVVTPIKNKAYSLTHKFDTVTQQKVTDVLALDFKTVPRVKRSGTKYITLHNRKYATREECV